MAREIGEVKSFVNGIFYVRDIQGNVHQLKVGEMISEGDHVYGAYGNTLDAKIVIDVLLNGAGDIVLAADGAIQFDSSLLATIFSNHEINSMSEGLAITAAAEVQMQSAAEEKTAVADTTGAGDETAAGNVVGDTERLADAFVARDGLITDVATDLRATAPNIAEASTPSIETTLLATAESTTEPTSPPSPQPPVEAHAPTLDVVLGEATRLVTPIYSNTDSYNLHQHNNTTGNIEFDGSANSVTIELKSYKTDVDDGQILLKGPSGEVIETINIDSLFSDTDPHNQPVTISFDTPFYGLEVLNFVTQENTNSEFKVEGINADMVSYQYPLNIVEASGENLSDITVTGFGDLPDGATLSNGTDIYILDSDTFTFSSADADVPASWTLTVPSELPEDTSIIASLTSTESDGSSAAAYVGVYGDNVIDPAHFSLDGNDTLTYDSQDTTIDGGSGVDTLILTGTTNIDFHTLSSNTGNIEVIDLTSGDHNLSSITFADVVNMTESGNSNIYIIGDAADTVGFLNSGDWSQTGISVSYDINGTTYMFNEYTSSEDPTVVVRVETDVPVI